MRGRREAGKSTLIEVTHDPRLGMTEMVLAALDVPGLLAEVAAVLYANRIEVVDAAIYSRQPADGTSAPRRWTCSGYATTWGARSPTRRAGRRCARIWRRCCRGG